MGVVDEVTFYWIGKKAVEKLISVFVGSNEGGELYHVVFEVFLRVAEVFGLVGDHPCKVTGGSDLVGSCVVVSTGGCGEGPRKVTGGSDLVEKCVDVSTGGCGEGPRKVTGGSDLVEECVDVSAGGCGESGVLGSGEPRLLICSMLGLREK